MSTDILTLYIQLPECHSLKEKRALIKPILARLRRNFNVSAAEVGLQDKWQEAVLACAAVGNDRTYTEQMLQKLIEFVQTGWPNIYVSDQRIEIL